MIRLASVLVGLAILGAAAHVNIAYTGGYDTPHAILTLAVAAGLAVGSIAVGAAWSDRRRAISCVILAALLAGEAFALSSTAERLISQRDAAQAPIREARERREMAAKRLAEAEADLAQADQAKSSDRLALAVEARLDARSSERLRAAEAAKAAADRAALEKAAERGCAANCRALLQDQVARASAEVTAARAEVEALTATASREVKAAQDEIAARHAAAAAAVRIARADFDAARMPPSPSPLADRLGVAAWIVDVVVAALGSVSANGLAAGLIAFGGHRPRARVVDEVPRAPAHGRVDAFAADLLHPRVGSSVGLTQAYRSYSAWCIQNGRAPVSPDVFADEFAELLKRLGVPVRLNGPATVLLDVTLEQPNRSLPEPNAAAA